MNSYRKLAAVSFVSLIALLLSACAPKSEESWTNMIDSLDGWDRVGDANWRIENGELIADASSVNSHLVTKESFADFQIQLEFWNHEGANSGVYMRITDPKAITDSTGYEANIYDERADQSGRTGGIPNFLPPSEALNTWDKWNTYDITMKGNHIVVLLNGVKTVDGHDDNFSDGPISLQYGRGTIKFRNVRIRRL